MDIDIQALLCGDYESVKSTAKEHVLDRLGQAVNQIRQTYLHTIRDIETQQSSEGADLVSVSVENGLIRLANNVGVELFCKLKVDQQDSGPVLFSETFFMPSGLLTIDPAELLPNRLGGTYTVSVYGLKDNCLSKDFAVYM